MARIKPVTATTDRESLDHPPDAVTATYVPCTELGRCCSPSAPKSSAQVCRS